MKKQRFTPQKKVEIVMEAINTQISTAELCRKHNIHPQTFYTWREKFIAGGKAAVVQTRGITVTTQKEIESLKRLIEELAIANNALKKTLEAVRG